MESHPVDIYVGKKLRSRRTLLGKSQEEIGTAVGVTFQQIQKYERGMNRVGSSRLYEFANLLGISVSYFFEGFEESSRSASGNTESSALAEGNAPFEYEELDNKEVLSLVRAYYGISNSNVRKKILSLMKSLSAEKEEYGEDSSNKANASESKKLASV